MRSRTLPVVVAACFLISGAAALVYEVVWMRLLGLLFGHTVYAVTTVLATYMGGLALGSLVFGRWSDHVKRPLRAYALFEAAIGAYCLLTPLLFGLADGGYLSLHHALEPSAAGATAIQLVFSILLLILPTTLMGATLPLLSRAVVERGDVAGARIGTLYAVNTWGAVLGTAATGFFLLPTIGLRATVVLAVALNAIVAAVALLLDRRFGIEGRSGAAADRSAAVTASATPSPPQSGGEGQGEGQTRRTGVAEAVPAETTPLPPRLVTIALIAIGVSGASSMAYEVAWTRALSLVLGSSVYAFSAMLTTFLTGLALGSLLVSRALRGRRLGLGAFAVIECAVALVALLLLPVFGLLPEAFLSVMGSLGLSHGSALAAQFTASFAVMIVPTLLIGATFPLVIAALARGVSTTGRDVGTVYGANTIGTIAGSAGAGFLLIPLAGIQNGIVVAAAANLVAGLAVLWSLPGRRRPTVATTALVGAFVLLAAALPRWDRKIMSSGVSVYAQQYLDGGDAGAKLRQEVAGRELAFYDEALNTTVAVMKMGDTLALTINGKLDGGNGVDMRTQLLLGHLPSFLHLDAKRVLVIGLGTGMTAGAIAQHPVERVDVAEIEPAIIEAARFFSKESHDVLDDPRVRVLANDGRHVLAASKERWDLIVSEPSNPWIAGIANLFTRDFYAQARGRLAPSGIFIQWLQGYSIYEREMRMVVRTFSEVFPHVTVWRVGRNDYLLVGSLKEPVVDVPAIEKRLAASPGARADLERLGLGAEDIPDLFLLSDADARRFGEGAPLNTDDLPLLEFAAPRALYAANAAEHNERLLRSYQHTRWPAVRGLDAATLDAPAAVLARARRQWLTGRFAAARTLLEGVDVARLDGPAARAERARLLFVVGRLDEATAELEALERAGARDPSLGAWAGAARAIRARGVGLSLLHQLANLRGPAPADTYEAFAGALLQVASESGERAILPLVADQLEAAVAEEPGRASALGTAALVYLELGRPKDALRVAERAVALQPDDPRARFALGGAYELGGRRAEAARAYAEAARLAPEWPAPAEKLQALGGTPR